MPKPPKRKLFWGYYTRDGVNIAYPEKAFLDLLYIRHLKNGEMSEERLFSMWDDMYLEELNQERLLF
ncbi:hypothetical protein HY00_01050 [Peptococcaceae bacterium SCADC1_2_3]|jgi:hypothetical protein|nr:hypothetical protein HY00_01050 [Peptococcaceae bacterium SCADC1_2_3]